MKGNEEEALTLTLQQNGDEIEERKMEESPLSGGDGGPPPTCCYTRTRPFYSTPESEADLHTPLHIPHIHLHRKYSRPHFSLSLPDTPPVRTTCPRSQLPREVHVSEESEQPNKLAGKVRLHREAELIYVTLKSERIFEMDNFKIVGDFVPHSPEAVDLEKKLSWFPPLFPLKEFREYFGEELAFVYAWSNFWWTFGLLPIAIFSLLTLVYGLATELHPESILGEKSHFWRVFTMVMLNPSVDYYLGFLIVWISVFQYQWSKAAPIFSLQWGVANFHKEEEINVSSRNKKFRKFIKIPNLIISLGGFLIAALLTFLIFITTEVVVRIQLNKLDFGVLQTDEWNERMINKTFIISMICSIFYTILNHLAGLYFIPWLSNFLTSLENHTFESYFNNSVIFKHTGYYLMSSYWYLIYIVFRINVVISEKFDVDLDAIDECPQNGICIVTITQQIVFQILELRLAGVAVSLLKSLFLRFRRKEEVFNVQSRDLLYILQNYKSLTFLSSAETSTWMTERVLMYGYLTLFSYHLPLVSLLALVLESFITYYEMRMLLRSQRPQPRRVGNIKQWEGIIYLINIMCVVVNSLAINQRYQGDVRGTRSDELMDGVPLFYIMPLFIFVTSLIHIQGAVSGDKVQSHVHRQYIHATKLLSGNNVQVDGSKTTTL
ncbi:hypothetical protein ACHWQZ_G013814 [Mnemiopsis leidyi]